MTRDATVIIGGGISGLCTAWYLARRGRPAVVLERGAVDDSASGRNAGILAAGHPPLNRPGLSLKALRWMLDRRAPLYVPPRLDFGLLSWMLDFHRACTPRRLAQCMDVLAPLGRLAMDGWREILAAGDLDCAHRPSGWLSVYRSEAGRREAEHEADATAAHGFSAARLDGAALCAREPAFGHEVLGAVHYTDSASLDPAACQRGLAACLAGRGVEIRTATEAAGLIVEDGRCAGVRLITGEEVRGDDTVLAAGVWSADLAAAAGLRLPMQAGKGYFLDLAMPDPPLETAAVLAERFVAVNPLGGRLRLAGTVEFSGTNQRLVRRRLEMLREGAASYLRGVASAAVLDEGCALRPCTADGLPVLGPAPRLPGLFVFTGGAKMGMTLAPGCARLAAEWLVDGRASLDVAALRADRF
jgi:D-amino-acid dehydrogenase